MALAALKSLVGDDVMLFGGLVGEGSFLPKRWVFYLWVVYSDLLFDFSFHLLLELHVTDLCSHFFLCLQLGLSLHVIDLLFWFEIWYLPGVACYWAIILSSSFTILGYVFFGLHVNDLLLFLLVFWYKLLRFVLISMLWVCCLVFFPSSSRACYIHFLFWFFLPYSIGVSCYWSIFLWSLFSFFRISFSFVLICNLNFIMFFRCFLVDDEGFTASNL